MTNSQLFFTPHPALASVVNNIMIGRNLADDKNYRSFQFPPLPEHSIIFFPFDVPRVEDVFTNQKRSIYPCTVTGPQTERNILSLGPDHLMVKIGFQPGALHRLLGISMSEMLIYKDYDGESIFGGGIKRVLEACAKAKNFETLKTIADDFMIGLLPTIRRPHSIDLVIPEILRSGGMANIDSLVKGAYLSNRQFERVFKERMGVSAKFYSRLVRFTKAWLMKESNPHMTWTKVAYECNYFDQMHMIRDFKVFANANPKEISSAFEEHSFLAVKRIFY